MKKLKRIKELVMKPALEAPHWKVHDCAQSFVLCSHNFLNYVAVTFLLVSSSSTNHDPLCFAYGQGQESEQKH